MRKGQYSHVVRAAAPHLNSFLVGGLVPNLHILLQDPRNETLQY